MNIKEYRYTLRDEIGAINLAIEYLQRIYKRNPDSLNAQNAIRAMDILNNVQKEMKTTLKELDDEFYSNNTLNK